MPGGQTLLKLFASIASGIAIGVTGTLITLNWQEEKLRYELSAPAVFGEILYQNLRLSNDGWNPATNVKVFLTHPTIRTHATCVRIPRSTSPWRSPKRSAATTASAAGRP